MTACHKDWLVTAWQKKNAAVTGKPVDKHYLLGPCGQLPGAKVTIDQDLSRLDSTVPDGLGKYRVPVNQAAAFQNLRIFSGDQRCTPGSIRPNGSELFSIDPRSQNGRDRFSIVSAYRAAVRIWKYSVNRGTQSLG